MLNFLLFIPCDAFFHDTAVANHSPRKFTSCRAPPRAATRRRAPPRVSLAAYDCMYASGITFSWDLPGASGSFRELPGVFRAFFDEKREILRTRCAP